MASFSKQGLERIWAVIPKSERERARLIREAPAIYDRIFPAVDPVSKQRDKAPVGYASGAYAPAQRWGSRVIKIIAVLCGLVSGKLPRVDRRHLGLR